MSYRLNLEFQALVNDQLRRLAGQLLSGEVGIIAGTRAITPFRHEVETAWPELGEALLVFVAIDSETDALPIGGLREMWHPATAALQDQKLAAAEEHFRPAAHEASRRVLDLLGEGP